MKRPVPYVTRCIYCGHQTILGLACYAHQDLLALDPFYVDVPPVKVLKAA